MNRGFAAIGLHHPKDKANVGGVLRAAHCYGASMVAISGERIKAKEISASTNTTATQRHMPVLRGDLKALIPYDCVPVAVELVDEAVPIFDFIHPHSAFYIFGPEDGTLGKAVLDWCPHKIMIPTTHCMNLACTVNVVLFDRMSKAASKYARVAA
jgi:tRNA(Leu) C34 or U34 (ribose-2'-O)-methylase TrmL